MANIIYVDTLDHPGLDAFARLTEAQLRNRKEPEKGIFIAESPKVIERALNGGYEPLSFLMEEKHITGQAQPLLERCSGVPVYTGPSDLLAQLTGFPLTRGVLCAMRRPLLPSVEQLCRNAHRVAVLEGIADPTNVGAIFRSAAAMHMDAVLVTPNCCDPLYRRSVRVSMGTVFQIPWTRIPQWPEGGLEQLHTLGFRTPWPSPPTPTPLRTPASTRPTSWPCCWVLRGTGWPGPPSTGATRPCASPCPTMWTPSMWPPPVLSLSGNCATASPLYPICKIPHSFRGFFVTFLTTTQDGFIIFIKDLMWWACTFCRNSQSAPQDFPYVRDIWLKFLWAVSGNFRRRAGLFCILQPLICGSPAAKSGRSL